MAQNNTLSLGEFVRQCLAKWKRFAISVACTLLLTIVYLIITPPKYTKAAQVLIKDDSAMGGLMGQLGGLAELGGLVGMNMGASNVYNELYAMQSPWLLLNVVHQLDLDMSYVIKGIRNQDLYDEELPITVKFKTLTEEDDIKMKVDLKKNGELTVYKIKKNDDKYDDEITGRVNTTLKSSIGDIEIKATPYLSKMEDDEVTITVKRTEPMAIVDLLSRKRLNIAVSNREASIIDIECKDVNKLRATNIINAIIAEYRKEVKEDKEAEAAVSERYVVERMAALDEELKTLGQRVADYKSKTMMPDLEVMATAYAESAKDIAEAQMELQAQLYVAEAIRDYLRDESKKDELLPILFATENMGFAEQISEYNTIVLQRNKIIASSSKESPLVKDIDKQLAAMHDAVLITAEEAIKQLKIQLKHVTAKENEGKQLLATAPKKYIDGLTDEEDLKVLATLRVFLLQKREEAQMTKSLKTDVRLLTPPLGLKEQSSPYIPLVLICAFLLGLFIPASYIVVREHIRNS